MQNPAMVKQGFHLSNVIIIPDVILEEASKNLPNEHAFSQYYRDLFQILSVDKEIYVVSLELLFELLRGMVNKGDALSSLKNITLEAVRTNQTISGLINGIDIQSDTALESLRDAVMYNGKNAGERFITIFALVFLSMYFGPVYIFSEDEKGFYGPFRTFINNDRLMDLIHIDDTLDLIEQYRFLSYNSFIQSVFIKGNFGEEALLDTIEKK